MSEQASDHRVPLVRRDASQYPYDPNLVWSYADGYFGWGWEAETERWELSLSHWGFYYIQADPGG